MSGSDRSHMPVRRRSGVGRGVPIVQFRTPEDATAGLALDGIQFRGVAMRIRRPKDYIPPSKDGACGGGPGRGLPGPTPD